MKSCVVDGCGGAYCVEKNTWKEGIWENSSFRDISNAVTVPHETDTFEEWQKEISKHSDHESSKVAISESSFILHL